MEPSALSLTEAADGIKNKKFSAVELTQSVLKRIEAHEKKIGAFLTVCAESALHAARAVDTKIAKGEAVGRLAGIALAPKDIYLTRGIETTAGSRILKGFIPPYNGTVIERCLAEDSIIIGKTNLDEFAMGSSNENSAYKPVCNPWDIHRIPGGSSGGSAAAVSADFCTASLGTDTGGSIRQPASHCGIVGLKPTYGRVSRYGTVAYASSLDQMGPMTKTVADAALLMNVISGYDPHDSTSSRQDVPDFTKILGENIKGLKVGVVRNHFASGLSSDVSDTVQKALQHLESLGAILIDVELPHAEHSVATYYVIAPAEASSNLARYDGIRFGYSHKSSSLGETYRHTRGEGFGAEVKRRIMMGTYVLSAGYYDAYYVRAQKIRQLIHADFQKAFTKVDVIAGPTAPTAAFAFGEKTGDPVQMYLSDIFTIPTNLAGLPGMSLPCGLNREGLPIGLQLTGKAFDESTLFRTAFAYEQSTEWHRMKPRL